jgi:polyhydroxybutyrate depolymerase
MRSTSATMVALSVAGSLALAGCSSSAKKAVTSPAPAAATSAAPSSAAPSSSPAPTPTPSPTETHLPPLTHTPGPTRPTLHIAPPPATHPAARVCHLSPGAQTIDGRLVILDLPATFPAPVVIDFHGGNQSAAQEHGYTGLGPVGAARGFIVATPNGTNGLWNFSGTEPLPDDAAFTQTIATLLAFAGCSNGRVYTAGISDGADMAVAAACRVPAVRAVFAVAPSITPRGACTKKPYLEVHGTADPIVPYYGSANGSFPDVPSEPVASRLPFWTAGCSGPVTGASPRAGTVVQRWSCAAGRTVQLYTVDGGGHTWPGAVGPEPAPGLGARAAWSADSVALNFFLDE